MVLRATFQHLPTVGPRTEAFLWSQGVRDWGMFPESPPFRGVGRDRWDRIRAGLAESEEALRRRDAGYFARRLPASEHWRLYREFQDRTAFLDIETTGLSPYQGYITVVTVHGGDVTRTFQQGEDLPEVGAFLSRYSLLVTFNGSLFDVPFLEAHFPEIRFPPAHADLRFLLRRIGQRGGLKVIEKRLGMGHRDGVEGIDGLEAVRLWNAHLRGVPGALERLVEYNRADTVNLEPLMRYAVGEMERRLLHAEVPEMVADSTSDARLEWKHEILRGD